MSETYTGVVGKAFEKNGRHSLAMDDDNWYGCSFTDPKVEAGQTIKFEWTFDKTRRYRNVDTNTIKIKPGTERVQTKSSGGKSSFALKDQYWADKEARDIDTQKRISYQAAMNTAMTFVNQAMAGGFMAEPKGSIAAKNEAYLAIVTSTAEEFFRVYQNLPENFDAIMGVAPEDQAVVTDDVPDTADNKKEDDWDE